MGKFAMAVHGGVKPFSAEIEKHKNEYEYGIHHAIAQGMEILKPGGAAIDAVHAAVRALEDNPFFNAGRGSAYNNSDAIEMDASIMNGRDRSAGAVAMLHNVKNPISLARAVMERTSHVFLAGESALIFAQKAKLELHGDSYFKTPHQYAAFVEDAIKNERRSHQAKVHGTVGAVAVDIYGNVASATSTGGAIGQMPGRISDSCMIGAGCFADNRTCAVSATGDGEWIIKGVIAHCISSAVEYARLKLQDACDYIIHRKNGHVPGDMGVIAVDRHVNIGISFNSDCMIRGWKTGDEQARFEIFKL